MVYKKFTILFLGKNNIKTLALLMLTFSSIVSANNWNDFCIYLKYWTSKSQVQSNFWHQRQKKSSYARLIS